MKIVKLKDEMLAVGMVIARSQASTKDKLLAVEALFAKDGRDQVVNRGKGDEEWKE